MAKNYFVLSSYRDLDKVYNDVILWFKGKQYLVDGVLKNGVYIVQAKKSDTIRTILGTNIAFKVKIYLSQSSGGEFIIETSRGKWIQNIAGASFGAIFTGGLTYLTGIASASWTFVLENELISYLESSCQLSRVQPVTTQNQDAEVWYSDKSNNPCDYKTPEQKEIISNLEAEIRRLEEAFANDILTEGEFNQKKSILEKQVDDHEVNFVIEYKVKQLQDAFAQGILSQDEYSSKLEQLEAQTRDQILQEKYAQRNRVKMIKLKEALNSGIITQAEYERKVASL
ncbi:MAG: SHOCT domain-containing protein [Cyanobacterium sp.]